MGQHHWRCATLLWFAAVAAPAFAGAQIVELVSYRVDEQRPYYRRGYITHRAVPARRWKINTHLFAANIALKDALNDGMVNIPPFGDFPVALAALSALKAYPAAYRAGVLGPDLFPEMYTGGWAIHSDLLESERWLADDWMRHVWSRAREWPEQNERDRVMAFAYGFLTHAAGDMFAHTYVSRIADGAWVSGPDFPKPHSTAIKHIVLEGYIGSRTPPTDETLDVWPRFVAEALIKDPAVRQHTRNLKHYQAWLSIYDWLGPQIQKARSQMNDNIRNDAPYWMKCSVNPVACAKKEQMESWRLDIDRGLRALVDSSQTLGEKMMDGKTTEGISVMTGWASEWVPKMFGAHVIGEGAGAMAEFMDWANAPLEALTEPVKAEIMSFLKQQVPYFYNLYQSVQNPSYYMDHVDDLGVEGFPAGTKDRVNADLHIQPGRDSLLTWREFEPLYNSVVLSKLALLDGDGLNELVKRAGVSGQLFAPGPGTHVLLGVLRSLTQSYQWVGEVVDSKDSTIGPTKHGICGPEHVPTLPDAALCGIRQRTYSSKGPTGGGVAVDPDDLRNGPVGGFALWGHTEARDKIFRVIFKGYGPGPGVIIRPEVMDMPPAAPSARDVLRAVREVTEQTDRMRELVVLMQEKVAGVIPAASTAAPAQSQPQSPPAAIGARRPATGTRLPLPTRPAPTAPPKGVPAPAAEATSVETITNWGERCCAKDIAELRAALATIRASSGGLRDQAVLRQLRQKSATDQISARGTALNAAIDAFVNTSDARSAGSALSRIAAGVETLAQVIR